MWLSPVRRLAREYLNRSGTVTSSPLRRGFACGEVPDLPNVVYRDLAKLVGPTHPVVAEVHDDIDRFEIVAVGRGCTAHRPACVQITRTQPLNHFVGSRASAGGDLRAGDDIGVRADGTLRASARASDRHGHRGSDQQTMQGFHVAPTFPIGTGAQCAATASCSFAASSTTRWATSCGISS